MAVDSFNLAQALNSQSYAFKCWNNYYYGNNTMGISSKDMGEITQTWNSELANWKAVALDDENAYDIPDDDFSKSYQNGKDAGKEATGYDGKKGGAITRTVVDAGLGVAGALGATVGKNVAGNIGVKVGGSLVANAGKKAAEKAATKAAEEATAKALEEGATEAAAKAAGKAAGEEVTQKSVKQAGSWSVAAPLALAQATLYMAKKPNKDGKEACDALQDVMAESQAASISAQDEMTAMGEELMTLSDEAAEYNEDANDQIEEQKTEYDMYMASFMALKEKAEAGEALTDEEKALYKELGGLLTESGEAITETQEETGENVTAIYDDMGTYQEGYDYAAETVAEVQGITDYAESFDSATQTMCYVEGAAQTLNAASGIKAGIKAGLAAAGSLGFNAWAWACAAMGASAGVMSGIGAAEQFKWAGEVGTEIEARKATQDLNTDTSDMYDSEIDNYDGWMTGVEDLELEIPDEIEAPEDTELPGGTATGEEEEAAPAATGFGIAAATEETDDKKKEEEKADPSTGIS